eukprot:CAMPEP_0169254524 /NCGR_PEP_ID=MMETSP1016-20121227/39224_1 /TAXON_ID=342587 /ORGANISM="Karlodinium micrum, Strain CCMP2283" /LENGTH=79 /DNA_ID=CAMNT_0009335997 /DNA_START=389 /DNA_END=628 /DNA_ORIENTATION=+
MELNNPMGIEGLWKKTGFRVSDSITCSAANFATGATVPQGLAGAGMCVPCTGVEVDVPAGLVVCVAAGVLVPGVVVTVA